MNVEEMLEKMETDTVSYMKFCSIYAKDNHRAICLVEGHDATYYRVRVNSICKGDRAEFVKCGGKKQVIQTRELISKDAYYQHGKIFAFVDRDFDDLLENHLIYETPCHSIENLYTSELAFRTIIKDEFKMDEYEDESDFQTCIELYKDAQEKFHENIIEFNAWLICQNKKSKTEVVRLNLNHKQNTVMNEFINISLTSVDKYYDLAIINANFPYSAKVTMEEIEDAVKFLKTQNYQKVFRGKYEIDFLKKFLAILIETMNKRTLYGTYFSKRRSISFKTTDSELISQLSQHAETPPCLSDYINKIWSGNSLMISGT